MKNSLVIAAAALLGAADAGMHRMKLQKVPLHEQLVSNINRTEPIGN
jgi:saccharopepsin